MQIKEYDMKNKFCAVGTGFFQKTNFCASGTEVK